MSLLLLEELHDAALRCDEGRDIRAVLLTATGRTFSFGGDLKLLAEAGPDAGALTKRMTGHLHRAISIFQRMEKSLSISATTLPMKMLSVCSGNIRLAFSWVPASVEHRQATRCPIRPPCGTFWSGLHN